ncbi:PACE efflux transporter [Psychrobacter sp. F1192]|uniref:PACE efflux transporter n=1 Tax=Psychrobacter coccoides TaxID=2818440 RepID=A0ABS3NP02_9GAMM|nr:PACE efflux transporter [Psychrobacter coccoides]MBO1531127.1 PACE efflux transporter [Psychrobacter coccoides]
MITLGPIKRRLLYVALFEVFAITLTTLILVLLSGSDAQKSLSLAIIISIVAVIWNFVYNTLFEYWERRQQIKVRTFKVRSLHAIGFEGGLTLVCLPLYMLWYKVGLWTALTMEVSLVVSFLIFTFIFTLIFDNIFTLPQHTKTAKHSA